MILFDLALCRHYLRRYDGNRRTLISPHQATKGPIDHRNRTRSVDAASPIRFAGCSLVLFAAVLSSACGQDFGVRYERLTDTSNDVVFAYSRISGDGRFLAYSSTPKAGSHSGIDARVMRVLDLQTGREVFKDPGIDGYWAPDGTRLIYKKRLDRKYIVAIWNRLTSAVTLDVMPTQLGDYYSWGASSSGETLLTIDGWFLRVNGTTVSEPAQIPECPMIERGARPLLSRDGTRVSVFVGDELVLRNLRDCGGVVRTGIVAAKADWSRDGQFLAFHKPKSESKGFEIGIFDLATSRHLTLRTEDLGGSNYFPSWTDDGSLVFRHDGSAYRGFVRVRDAVASATLDSAPTSPATVSLKTSLPSGGSSCAVLMIWGAWGAHSNDALRDLAIGSTATNESLTTCAFTAATDPTSSLADVAAAVEGSGVTVPLHWVAWFDMRSAAAMNQNPTYLLLRDGSILDRRLGPQSPIQLKDWVARHFSKDATNWGAQ